MALFVVDGYDVFWLDDVVVVGEFVGAGVF